MSLLPPCGASYTDAMGGWTSYAAVDEGGGRVGLAYDNGGDQVLSDVPRGYYRLYDCRTGSAVGFDVAARTDIPAVEEFVARARRNGLMARPDALVASAARAGYPPASTAPWNAEDMTEYATCACGVFYPRLGASRGGVGQ